MPALLARALVTVDGGHANGRKEGRRGDPPAVGH